MVRFDKLFIGSRAMSPFSKFGTLLLILFISNGRVQSITERPREMRHAEVKIDAVPGKISLSPMNRVEISRTESTSTPTEIWGQKLTPKNRTRDFVNHYTTPKSTNDEFVSETTTPQTKLRIVNSSRVGNMFNNHNEKVKIVRSSKIRDLSSSSHPFLPSSPHPYLSSSSHPYLSSSPHPYLSSSSDLNIKLVNSSDEDSKNTLPNWTSQNSYWSDSNSTWDSPNSLNSDNATINSQNSFWSGDNSTWNSKNPQWNGENAEEKGTGSKEEVDLSNHNLNPKVTSSPRIDTDRTVMIGSENDTFFVVKVQGPTESVPDSEFAAAEDHNYINNPEFFHKNGEAFPSASGSAFPSKSPEEPTTEVVPFYPILPDQHPNLLRRPMFEKNLYQDNFTFSPYVYPPQFQKLSSSFPNHVPDCRHGPTQANFALRRRPLKRTTAYSSVPSARAYLKKTSPGMPNVVKHTIKVYEREVDDDDGLFSSDDSAPSGSGGFFGVDFSDLAARTKRAPIISQIMDSIMGMVDLTTSEDNQPMKIISSMSGLPSSDKYLYLPIREEDAPEYIPVMENIVVKHGTVIKKNPFPPVPIAQPLIQPIPSIQPFQPLVRHVRRPKVRATSDGAREVPPWSLTALPPPLPTVNPSSRTGKSPLPWALQPLPPPLPTIHPSSSINYQLWLLQPATTYPSEPGVDATTGNANSYTVSNDSKPDPHFRPGNNGAVTIKLNPKRGKDIQMVKSIDLTKQFENQNINYYNKINNGSRDSYPAYSDTYRQSRPSSDNQYDTRQRPSHDNQYDPRQRPSHDNQYDTRQRPSHNHQYDTRQRPSHDNQIDSRPEQSNDGFQGSFQTSGGFVPSRPPPGYRRPIAKPPKPPALLLKIVPHEQSMIIESPIKFNLELRETNQGRSQYGRSHTPRRVKSPPIPGVGRYKEGRTDIEFFKPVVIDIDGDGSQRLMTEEELVREDSRHFRSGSGHRKRKSRPREKVADSVRLPLNLHETYEAKVPAKAPAPFDLEYDQSTVRKTNESVPLHLRVIKKEDVVS